VIKGETLWTIAQHYRVQVADLVSANVILDPTRLDVGRRVFVPLKPGADPGERKLLEASKPATILQVEGGYHLRLAAFGGR
jgi:LysM repeat protein